MKNKTNIEKSFIIGLVCLSLIVLSIFISIASIHWGSEIVSYIIGLSYFTAGILSIIGTVYFIKGIKDKLTYKTVIAFIINVGIVALFIALIIANLNDLSLLINS